MKKKLALLLTTLTVFSLVGCGSSTGSTTDTAEPADTTETTETAAEAEATEGTTITVGASITPHSEILYQAQAILAEEGINLEVVEIEDVVTPNTGVAEGSLDANFFQHQPYLDDFNEQNGTDLVSLGTVHYEPFGIYTDKLSSLDELEDGALVAVPNNVTNEARALLLLEQEGVLTLKEGVGIAATINDIEENPKNISFIEVDPSQLVNTLPDVAIAVINGNYAIEGGLSVNDALAIESDQGVAAQTYANVLVTTSDKKDDPALLRLLEVLQSAEIAEYINATYGGAVVPLHGN